MGYAVLASLKLYTEYTASLQFRWLAQPRLHGLFEGEVLVFLLFKGKLIKHANHRMRQEAVYLTVQPELFYILGSVNGVRIN